MYSIVYKILTPFQARKYVSAGGIMCHVTRLTRVEAKADQWPGFAGAH